MAGIYTLGKQERLRSRKAIEQLFRKGQRLGEGPFRAIWLQTGEAGLRVAVGVSTRLFKKATHRNRIKRLLRESFRLNKLPLKEAVDKNGIGLDLFLSYNLDQLPDHSSTELAVKRILEKLLKRLNEGHSSNT